MWHFRLWADTSCFDHNISMTIKDDLCFKILLNRYLFLYITTSVTIVTGVDFKMDSHGVRHNYFELVNIEHKSLKIGQNNDLPNIVILRLLKQYSISQKSQARKPIIL